MMKSLHSLFWRLGGTAGGTPTKLQDINYDVDYRQAPEAARAYFRKAFLFNIASTLGTEPDNVRLLGKIEAPDYWIRYSLNNAADLDTGSQRVIWHHIADRWQYADSPNGWMDHFIRALNSDHADLRQAALSGLHKAMAEQTYRRAPATVCARRPMRRATLTRLRPALTQILLKAEPAPESGMANLCLEEIRNQQKLESARRRTAKTAQANTL